MSIYFELCVSWVVMGISTGVHVHLCVRVRYACVQYLYGAWAWAAYSLLDRVYGQSLYWSLFATFRVCTCRTVFGLDSASRNVC